MTSYAKSHIVLGIIVLSREVRPLVAKFRVICITQNTVRRLAPRRLDTKMQRRVLGSITLPTVISRAPLVSLSCRTPHDTIPGHKTL